MRDDAFTVPIWGMQIFYRGGIFGAFGRGHFRSQMFLKLCGARALLLVALLSCATISRAEFQLLWEIGTEDNPVQFSFDVRHGFAGANRLNDPPPGQVTRLPGDPQYNPTNNSPADDDFYLAGF